MKKLTLLFFCCILIFEACTPFETNSNSVSGIPSKTNSTMNENNHSPSETPSPTPEPTLTITPSPTPCIQIVSKELSIYEGPGEEYPSGFSLTENDRAKVIGKAKDCKWLKISTEENLEGWLQNHPAFVINNFDCVEIEQSVYRPLNGTIIRDNRQFSGYGEIEVTNKYDVDTIILLSLADGITVVTFYVRSNDTFTFRGLADGNYLIYFILGTEWVEENKCFSQIYSVQKFQEIIDFKTLYNELDKNYTTWSLNLGTQQGSSLTEDIQIDKIPDY